MVERAGSPFRSANAGELSPDAAGRIDVKQFYSSGLRYKNVEPVSLSGFKAMAGSFDTGTVRGRVAPLAASGIASTPGPHTGTTTIWQGTVAGVVAAVDCAALDASTGEHTVQAQVLVGAAWVNLGSPVTVGTAARALTLAAAPAKGLAATAVRLQATFSVSASITTGTVTVLMESNTQDRPRYTSMKHDSGARYFASLQLGFMDVFEDDAFAGAVYLPDVTADMLPHVDFYAEDATIGIAFNTGLATQRVRRGASGAEWTRDLWPFTGIPKVDLGGTYAKTDDKWEVNVKYAGTPFLYLTLAVDGEDTPGIAFVDAANLPVAAGGAVDLTLTASNIQAALVALPSLGAGMAVVVTALAGATYRVDITFGGALSGDEYQVVSNITNTAEASALATHVQTGKTDFEPLFSATRGWPGGFGFAQDRLGYIDIAAVPPAISLSQAGEYFNINIDAAGVSAARLDKLRAGQVSERVLALAEATYLLAFTDRAVHFASNRTISKTEPLNWVQASDAGSVPNCKPVKLEGKIYFVGVEPKSDPPTGHQILSLGYSEIETNFDAVPESIFFEHLTKGLVRFVGQVASSESGASKLWALRDDGRLVVANIIKSQEVLGACEWVLADGGRARELHVDAGNDVRLCVERGGRLRHERLDAASLFQAATSASVDLAGGVAGLGHLEGRAVWAEVDGYVLGPFTVTAGSIALGDAYAGPALVGLWQPPVWESMPRWLVTRNDEVVRRPGRIYGVRLQLLGTASIAVAANGSALRNVPLTRTTDSVEQPLDAKEDSVRVVGLEGFKIGTTLVVSQVRPGRMQVRDLDFQEKL